MKPGRRRTSSRCRADTSKPSARRASASRRTPRSPSTARHSSRGYYEQDTEDLAAIQRRSPPRRWATLRFGSSAPQERRSCACSTPRSSTNGWVSEHTIVETVNERHAIPRGLIEHDAHSMGHAIHVTIPSHPAASKGRGRQAPRRALRERPRLHPAIAALPHPWRRRRRGNGVVHPHRDRRETTRSCLAAIERALATCCATCARPSRLHGWRECRDCGMPIAAFLVAHVAELCLPPTFDVQMMDRSRESRGPSR